MQDFAELHLKPETLARHDFSLGIELMIAVLHVFIIFGEGVENGGIER